jgi:hypothetical protein
LAQPVHVAELGVERQVVSAMVWRWRDRRRSRKKALRFGPDAAAAAPFGGPSACMRAHLLEDDLLDPLDLGLESSPQAHDASTICAE